MSLDLGRIPLRHSLNLIRQLPEGIIRDALEQRHLDIDIVPKLLQQLINIQRIGDLLAGIGKPLPRVIRHLGGVELGQIALKVAEDLLEIEVLHQRGVDDARLETAAGGDGEGEGAEEGEGDENG